MQTIISFLYIFFKANSNDQRDAKRTKTEDDDDIAKLVCVKRIKNEHLLDLNWLSDSELVVVGVNPVTLIAQLPPSLKEKRFGIS